MTDWERQHRIDHEWHVAINRFHWPKVDGPPIKDFRHWMYEAKRAWGEVPRLILLHRAEREGTLAKTHRHCSRSPEEAVPENHLTCCLGVKCRECPELLALDAAKLTDEERDEAKAWTCTAHILTKGGDRAGEGYLLTVDDRMFWDRTYANMAATDEPDSLTSGFSKP